MAQQLELLLHVNGGEPHVTKCATCGTTLGDDRASPRCPDGRVRFFCVPERGDDPQYSCYVQWIRSRH